MRSRHNKARLTGDDLRSALAALADFEPDSQRVLAAVLAADEPSADHAGHPRARAPRKPVSPRAARTQPRRPVAVLRAAVAIGVAAVVAVLVAEGTLANPGGGSPIARRGQSTEALRRAILTAFQSTLSEIAYSRVTDVIGGRVVARAQAWDWEGTAPPRWMRRQLLMTPAGLPILELAEDAAPARSCPVCPRNARTTVLVVSYPARTWTENRIRVTVRWGHEPLKASQIRQVVGNEGLRVIRRKKLAGAPAIELALAKSVNGSPYRYRLWVNARTYLPVRFEQVITRPYLGLPAGLTITSTFRFLPPTPQNIALARPVSPPGQGWRRETVNSFDSRPHVLLHDMGRSWQWLSIFQLLVGK